MVAFMPGKKGTFRLYFCLWLIGLKNTDTLHFLSEGILASN
jgi:hypothetical protein